LKSLLARKSSLSNLIGAGNFTKFITSFKTQASPIVFPALTRTNKTIIERKHCHLVETALALLAMIRPY
jgi:hypothetical protein